MKKLIYLLMLLPFMVKAQNISIGGNNPSYCVMCGNEGVRFGIDTIKIVMLVSDTSTVENKQTWPATIGSGVITLTGINTFILMQDTRPYMTYGYQTSTGEFLDAYKKKLGKNIVMWIAYKTK